MKILLVDDEPLIGSTLGRILKRLGHETVFADHPATALDLLDGDVDFVISDLHMPGMNGVALARAIRERCGSIPIGFCTGSDLNDDSVRQAAELGPVLPKPWTREQLIGIIEELASRCIAGQPA